MINILVAIPFFLYFFPFAAFCLWAVGKRDNLIPILPPIVTRIAWVIWAACVAYFVLTAQQVIPENKIDRLPDVPVVVVPDKALIDRLKPPERSLEELEQDNKEKFDASQKAKEILE